MIWNDIVKIAFTTALGVSNNVTRRHGIYTKSLQFIIINVCQTTSIVIFLLRFFQIPFCVKMYGSTQQTTRFIKTKYESFINMYLFVTHYTYISLLSRKIETNQTQLPTYRQMIWYFISRAWTVIVVESLQIYTEKVQNVK